jgi:serine/threonine protein kinase
VGPWTDIYSIGATIYACMSGVPPMEVPQRLENDEFDRHLERQRNVYGDGLIEVVRWCMALDARERPQSVFSLQRELGRELGRRPNRRATSNRSREPRGTSAEALR